MSAWEAPNPLVRLSRPFVGVADAAGGCTIIVGTPPGFRRWTIGRTIITASDSPLAVASMYRGLAATPSALLGSSAAAQSDVSTDGYRLESGEVVMVVFGSCAVGAQCVVIVEGDDTSA